MSRQVLLRLCSGLLLVGVFACGDTIDRSRDEDDSSSRPDASSVKKDGGPSDGGGCVDPLVECGASCVNVTNDRKNCGACDNPCDPGEECVNRECQASACAQSCGTGYYCDSAAKECRPGCAADFDCPQPGSCNTSTHACSCSVGTHACGDRCASNNSPDSCGDSCSPCPAPENGVATCDGETCGSTCDEGFHVCSGKCVSSFSTNSCGSSCSPCNAPWNGTATCDGNSCGVTCSAGTHKCGSNCASDMDTATCGSSCSPCPKPANGYATCNGSSCGIQCNAGYAACGGQCVAESASQCGSSCQACTSAPSHGTADCISGSCSFRCSAPYLKAGSNCVLASTVSSMRNGTCITTTNNEVRCWTTDVPGLNGVSAISSGDSHTCAIKSGALKCWGENGYGQLGDGTYNDSVAAVSVSFPSGTSTITQVSAGEEHTCAVTSSGQLFCWGRNYWGQLGNGTKTSSNKPVLISSTGIKQVAAGADFTCALLTSGGAQCWGYNYYGQLGNNSTTDSSIPVTVSNLSGASNLWAGDEHACALVNGGLKCWGNNIRNQVSTSECMRTYNDGCTTPRDMPGYTSGVASASLGTQLTCVLKTNGEVWCWGYNDYGQVGVGYRGGSNNTAFSGSAVVTNATAIGASAQGYHVCAVISGGGVKCWGYNSYGQLGDGTTTDRYTPVDATAPY